MRSEQEKEIRIDFDEIIYLGLVPNGYLDWIEDPPEYPTLEDFEEFCKIVFRKSEEEKMKEFSVAVPIRVEQIFVVEANSPDEAISLVQLSIIKNSGQMTIPEKEALTEIIRLLDLHLNVEVKYANRA